MEGFRGNLVTGGLLFFFGAMLFVPVEGVASGKAELKNLGNGVCLQANGLMWQVDKSRKFSSVAEAQEYAERLNLGEYNDWRLPTRDELYDLCDIWEMKLAGDCPIKIKGSYWSSEDGKVRAGEWESYPLCGGSEYKYLKKKSGSVRAVRP